MAQELGKVERPTAESFEGTRKLFFVPMVYSPTSPPADYVGMLERYWAGARNQVRRLADRTGPVRHIYHEAITETGEAGLKLIEQLSARSHALVIPYVKEDEAQVEAFEDPETFYEVMDWQRCLMSGLTSRKVMETAMNGYREATRRRYEQMIQHVQETLKPGESGILLMPEEHSLQFPTDIQVFYIAPPALDEIHRWLRERASRPPAEETAAAGDAAPAAPAAETPAEPA
jgi:hypothetical protein